MEKKAPLLGVLILSSLFISGFFIIIGKSNSTDGFQPESIIINSFYLYLYQLDKLWNSVCTLIISGIVLNNIFIGLLYHV